jgi:hypothetical protein
VALLVTVSATLFAAETAPAPGDAPQSKVEAPAPATPPAPTKPVEFKDPEGGFEFTIPAGYTRLSEDSVRIGFKGLSSYFGKDVAERTLVKPPVCFQGPIDPAHPKTQPPSLAIGFTALGAPVDPAQMAHYKEDYEQALKKAGESVGDVSVEVVSVNGVPSLRIEHDLFSPIDNTRMRIIKLSVPGHQRRYDIVFNFFSEQAPQVKESLDTVMKSFSIIEVADESTGRWTRIALWTVGGLVAGVVLGLLLSAIAGNKQPASAGNESGQ